MATTKKKVTKKKVAAKAATPKPEATAPVVPTPDDLEAEFSKANPFPDQAALVEAATKAASAGADDPSGALVGADMDFINACPHDIVPFLKRAKVPHEPEKFHYRWGSTNQRQYNKRRSQGYEPIAGIQKGDQIAMRLPIELKNKMQAQIDAKNRLYEGGESAKFDSEVRRQGGVPFDGPRSLEDGLS